MKVYYILMPLTMYNSGYDLGETYLKTDPVLWNTIYQPNFDYFKKESDNPDFLPFLAFTTKTMVEGLTRTGIAHIQIHDTSLYNRQDDWESYTFDPCQLLAYHLSQELDKDPVAVKLKEQLNPDDREPDYQLTQSFLKEIRDFRIAILGNRDGARLDEPQQKFYKVDGVATVTSSFPCERIEKNGETAIHQISKADLYVDLKSYLQEHSKDDLLQRVVDLVEGDEQ